MIYRFLSFSVDVERRELVGPNGPIPLQPQAFSLLMFLIDNRDRVVTKDEVFDGVWQGRIVGDSTLNARLNAVRKALGDDGARQGVIRTLPRQGFRFVADVTAERSDPADGPLPEAQKSLGVLPFVHIGQDPEQAYFADGLTEDLITDLSKVPDLFVIARNTAFSFKGSSKSSAEIAREMGVSHILEGSVRRSGDRLRINAQLVDAERGGPIWADRYDRDISDIFAVQDDITSEITTALEARLDMRPGVNEGATAEAYELCIRARALFFQFEVGALRDCIALLERAVEIAPGYARAWAEQVFPHQNAYSFGFAGFDAGLKTAIGHGQRAVKIDPSSGFAKARLGFALAIDGQHDTALRHFEEAVALEPNNAEVLAWYSEALNFAGRPEQAVDVAETCLHFDPVAPPNVLHHLAHAKLLLGDAVAAAELEDRVVRVVPSFLPSRLIAAVALTEAGRPSDAAEQIEDLLAFFPDFSLDLFEARYPYKDKDQLQRLSRGLAAAGLT